MISSFLESVKKELPQLKILCNEPLSRHTSFRIGGPAAAMIFPASIDELSMCLKILREYELKPLILGAGTNILAPDTGVDRIVICLKGIFQTVNILPGQRIEAYAGASLAKTAVAAKDAGLSGLEFAHGIPGTVGGGLYMNAGAYGGEMKDVAVSVTVMNCDGTVDEVPCNEDSFGYRTSVFEGKDTIILKAVFQLFPGNKDEIQTVMSDLMERRRTSQPLELPSAGSTFKRPVGGYAAALIDSAGLKGFRIGDAAVSQKHAGFVVNLGHATAQDVLTLVGEIQRIVLERSGIELNPEIRIW